MTRKVHCKKYNIMLKGLDRPPYPGPKGLEIFNTVSEKAWHEWLNHQKMLINENKMDLMNKNSRTWLNLQMDLFLENKEYSKPKGYVPE